MSELRRLPAGRAGRLWLRRRLNIARRGVELLDHQLRILRLEQERLALLVRETAPDWRDHCREAERWLLRAAVVGGQREIRMAADPVPARVDVTFRDVMGVRYPAHATVTLPEPSQSARPPGGAGLVLAIAAHRAAVRAAVRHAVAETALRIVEDQVVEVRRRKHAISDRWLPRLETALHGLEQQLEDQERDEQVRLHWVAALKNGPVP